MDAESIRDILIDLGYRLDDRGDYWQSNAIYRGGDNRTALQIYKDSGVWKDYVEDTGFLPFKALLEKSLEDSDPNLLKRILDKDGINALNTESKKETRKPFSIEEVYDNELLNKLLPHYKFYNDRGISDDTLKDFKGGLSTEGQMYQRFVFPVFNEFRQIHGFAGRDMLDKEGRPKWKHIGKKTKWVYPLHNPSLREMIEWQGKEVILVESIGDLLSIYENKRANALVTFGLDASPAVVNALISLAPSNIVIALNNDTSSSENRGLQAAVKNYLKLLKYFDADKLRICLPTRNDFGDMKEEDYKTWDAKLNNLKQKNQTKDILRVAEGMRKNNKISKTLYSNINYIRE
jgi:hypothetical protein